MKSIAQRLRRFVTRIRTGEVAHPYTCFMHGGSPRAAVVNERHGFTCPSCAVQTVEIPEQFRSVFSEEKVKP